MAGCGDAAGGAKHVHAIDINDDWLNHGRDLAKRAGVDGVTFSKTLDREKYDIVISLSAMEHFRDPGKELARMCSLTGEELLISWAEPWYSPYGTHLNGTTRLPGSTCGFRKERCSTSAICIPTGAMARSASRMFAAG